MSPINHIQRYVCILCVFIIDNESNIPLLFILVVGAPAKKGQKCGNSASITYEIKNNLPDQYSNEYPSRDSVILLFRKLLTQMVS